jgi:membrane associated rhomboid family serine protease
MVTIGLIVVNGLVFIRELLKGPFLDEFLFTYGLIPVKVWYAGKVPGLSLSDSFVPFVTSMFLHGGWLHIIGNMWYLWLFGDNVEDRLGHVPFLLFYLLCGIGAGAVHVLINSTSGIPTVGASGAVSGVLGAYMLFFPRARVVTLIPIFFFIQIVEVPAAFLLFFWFLMQFFSGTLSIASASQVAGGGVAWWAHIGGFLIGALAAYLLPKSRRARQTHYRARIE